MQQVSTQQFLANLEFVGSSVHGSGEQLVSGVWDRNDLELVQKQREIVALVQVT
jgi:hypothetical protein